MTGKFVDIQVNGYQGVDFSAPGLTLDDIRKVTFALTDRGVAAFCPTIVTAPEDIYRQNLPTLAKAMNEPDLTDRILGIHVEGPFISPEPGARGAHPLEHVRLPSSQYFDQLQKWADGRIVILTLSPELEGSARLIEHITKEGVVASLGHHHADWDSLQAAVDAGAALATHVGNGIAAQIHRHENPIWWQLACDQINCSFITDGHHLPAPLIKTALRAKTPDRFIVTSDVVRLGGLPPGEYEQFGAKVVLEPTGRVSLKDTGYLSGSSSSMLECMNHLASLSLLEESQLWQVGRDNALRLLGKDASCLEGIDSPSVQYQDGMFSIV